jgi:hypothetical protein
VTADLPEPCAEFTPCLLGDGSDPEHNFTCALLCTVCGRNEEAHLLAAIHRECR